MTRLSAYIVGSMIAVLTLGTFFSDRFVAYSNQISVLLFAAVLGVLMAYVKPVLGRFALPVSCLTFGLAALVLNALLFGIASEVTPGIQTNLWGTLFGGLLMSITSGIVYSIVDEH